MEVTEIILCIPGQWKNRSELVTALVPANGGHYIFAGNILMHVDTGESFEVEIEDRDARMAASFAAAGQGRLTETELTAIDKHTFVVYLIGKGGTQQAAEKTMLAGQAFLNAGGLGIKVETSGKAFTPPQWTGILNTLSEEKYYEAFVVFLRNGNNAVYSCGLHNIGMRDVICDAGMEPDAAASLIQGFIFYRLFERPVIEDRQTFSENSTAPVYRITEKACEAYAEDDLFYNPYGMYLLSEI